MSAGVVEGFEFFPSFSFCYLPLEFIGLVDVLFCYFYFVIDSDNFHSTINSPSEACNSRTQDCQSLFVVGLRLVIGTPFYFSSCVVNVTHYQQISFLFSDTFSVKTRCTIKNHFQYNHNRIHTSRSTSTL